MLRLDALDNFRDFGGWRAAGGARVCWGRLFRSAHHAQATATDLDRIGALGIATVTGLRHPSEQRREPSAWIDRFFFDLIKEAGEVGRYQIQAHRMTLRSRDFSYDATRALLRVISDYIASCWWSITARSGSIDAYLNDVLGVDEARCFRIRERFYL